MPELTEKDVVRIVMNALRSFTHESLRLMPDIAGVNRDHDSRYHRKNANVTLGAYYIEGKEITAPETPDNSKARIYLKDDSGTTKLCMKDDTGSETTFGGGGGGSVVNIKEGGVQVGDADIGTLDFNGTHFNVTESPDKEVNIELASITWAMVDKTTSSVADITTKNIDLLSDVDTTTDPPNNNEVLKWNGSNWVPAVYNYDFTFTLDSFDASGISGTVLIGSGIFKAIGAVSFTATYSNAPGGATAVVALTGASTPWGSNLTMDPITGPELNTEAVYYPSTRTGSLTFTLTPTPATSPTTRTDVQAFSNTMRYGTNVHGIGAQTEADIEALTEVSGPNESRSQTISNIPTGAGKYLTFSYADALSDVAQIQMNSGYGAVTASFNTTATTLAPTVQTGITNVANSAGFSETFAAVTSRLTDLTNGTNDFTLTTSSTAQNYIYWGELNKASSYTESDVEGNFATQPGKVASNSISSRSMVVNCAVDEYVYIAYPSRLGALTSIMIGGFESIDNFIVDNTALAVTNDGGYTENYRVYVSENPGFTNPTTMTVTI